MQVLICEFVKFHPGVIIVLVTQPESATVLVDLHADHDYANMVHRKLKGTRQSDGNHLKPALFADFAFQTNIKRLARIQFAAGPFPLTNKVAVDARASQQQTVVATVGNDGVHTQRKCGRWHWIERMARVVPGAPEEQRASQLHETRSGNVGQAPWARDYNQIELASRREIAVKTRAMYKPGVSPIVLGVCGHRYLDSGDESRVRKRMRLVCEAFSSARAAEGGDLFELRKALGFPDGKEGRRDDYLNRGLPPDTPVWLLTPLAEGADTLAAVEAVKFYGTDHPEDKTPFRHGFRLICPYAVPEESSRVDQLCREVPSGFADATRAAVYPFLLPLGGRNNTLEIKLGQKTYHRLKLDWDSPDLASESDPKTAERTQRQATNSYIALYSHVLVAVWDGNLTDRSVGTDSAVRLKIDGVAPHLINHGPVFNWADAGPVIQIYAENRNPDKPEAIRERNLITGTERVAGRLRNPVEKDQADWVVVHPDDCCEAHPRYQPGQAGVFDDPDREKERNTLCEGFKKRLVHTRDRLGRKIFGGILSHSLRFNRDLKITKTKTDDYGNPLKGYESQWKEDKSADIRIEQRLKCVSDSVELTSALSMDYKNNALRIYKWLFFMVGAAAVCFDVFAHWFHVHDDHPVHLPWVLMLNVLLLAAAAGLFFFYLQRSKLEARAYDYRALSEALRIQCYWMFGGLFQSVPINYLQRQRSGFDWIRNTVAALCFPYEDGQRLFDRLDAPTKLKRLRYIRKSWVEGQMQYYHSAAHRYKHNKHKFHMAGILTAAVGFVAAANLLLQHLLHYPFLVPKSVGHAFLVLSAVLTILLLISVFRPQTLLKLLRLPVNSSDNKKLLFVVRWILVSLSGLLFVSCSFLFPGFHADHPPEHVSAFFMLVIVGVSFVGLLGYVLYRWLADGVKLAKIWESVVPYLPLVVSLLMLFVFQFTVVEFSANDTQNAAKPSSVFCPYILLIGLPLLWGAMLVAWSEKQLNSELANQFSAMADLYRLINRRLRSILGEDPATPDDWIQNGDTPNEMDYSFSDAYPDDLAERILQAQDTLYELGKEALDENAEWLLLHRARPLEFPMAG